MTSRFFNFKKQIITIKTSRTYFNKKILTAHDMNIQKLKLKNIYSYITKLKETKEEKKSKEKLPFAWTYSSY